MSNNIICKKNNVNLIDLVLALINFHCAFVCACVVCGVWFVVSQAGHFDTFGLCVLKVTTRVLQGGRAGLRGVR